MCSMRRRLLICLSVIIIYAKFAISPAQQLKSNECASYNSRILWLKKIQELWSGIKHTKKSIWICWKSTVLRGLYNLMSPGANPIWNGMQFLGVESPFIETVKQKNASGNVVEDWLAKKREKHEMHMAWLDEFIAPLATSLGRHVLQINFKQLTESCMAALERKAKSRELRNVDPNFRARHRRHRYNMVITMVFGIVAFGAVLVPIGFQLLSMISGKALLLAKMALLLASINGIKRLANSGVHYGLYHVPGVPYSGAYYDRGDVHHPRNVPSLTFVEPLAIQV